MVLVDTSIIIDFINNNRYKEVITSLVNNKEFATTEIVIMEVLQGIRTETAFKVTKKFLESLPLISLKYKDYLKAAEIYRDCRKKGITVRKSVDCLIASVVINNKLKLFSNDRDFHNIQKNFNLEIF